MKRFVEILSILISACALTGCSALPENRAATVVSELDTGATPLMDISPPCTQFKQLASPGPNRLAFQFLANARFGEVKNCTLLVPRDVLNIVTVKPDRPVNMTARMLNDKRTFFVEYGWSGNGSGFAYAYVDVDLLLASTPPPTKPPPPTNPTPGLPPDKDCISLSGPDDGWRLIMLTAKKGCTNRTFAVQVKWNSASPIYRMDKQPRVIKNRGGLPTLGDAFPVQSGLGPPVDSQLVQCSNADFITLCENRSARWVFMLWRAVGADDSPLNVDQHALISPGARWVYPWRPPNLEARIISLEYESE